MRSGFVTRFAFIAALSSLASAVHGSDLRLRAVPLEPSSGNIVAVRDINASGVVAGTAGSSNINPGQHAVLWIDGVLSNLDPTFTISDAAVLNDAGVAAGLGAFCGPGDGPCTSMIARALPGGAFEIIGTLGGNAGEVLDINDAGDLVGWWYNQDNLTRAFVHTESGGLQNLGTLGGFGSQARAINDGGQVVGQAYTAAPAGHAFLWQDGVMSDLGTLGGTASDAKDINGSGLIVGWAQTARGEMHAFRVSAGGVMEDLHTLENAVSSRAAVVNDAGTIGGSWSDGTNEFLFIHTEEAGTIDLGAPVLPFFTIGPMDINEQGVMVGVGGTLVDNYVQPVAWIASLEHGVHVVTDLVTGTEDLTVTSVSAINDAGQIAAIGTLSDPFTSNPFVLEPVAAEDIDGDGAVGASDLLALLAAWGECPAGDPCLADIDGDGTVGASDLLALLAAWG